MSFKAMRHCIEVIIAYPTDEALGLEENEKYWNVRVWKARQKEKLIHISHCFVNIDK